MCFSEEGGPQEKPEQEGGEKNPWTLRKLFVNAPWVKLVERLGDINADVPLAQGID